ncbi:hypothetical protein IJ579_00995 [bacterium]|nr:hypothetical protein [bacterium]
MKVDNKIGYKKTNQQNFGMAFYRDGAKCSHYLYSTFNGSKFDFRRALRILDRRTNSENFDMFYSEADNAIKIIYKNYKAADKMKERYGSEVMVVAQDVVYPNVLETVNNDFDKMIKEIPDNLLEKGIFKLFHYITGGFAKLYTKLYPYEKLPANVRSAVKIIKELDSELPKSDFTIRPYLD